MTAVHREIATRYRLKWPRDDTAAMGFGSLLSSLVGSDDGDTSGAGRTGRDVTGTPSDPFRADVRDALTISGVGTVLVSHIEAGCVKTGDAIELRPAGVDGTVETIERHHEEVQAAQAGDDVGLAVDGIGAEEVVPDSTLRHADR